MRRSNEGCREIIIVISECGECGEFSVILFQRLFCIFCMSNALNFRFAFRGNCWKIEENGIIYRTGKFVSLFFI